MPALLQEQKAKGMEELNAVLAELGLEPSAAGTAAANPNLHRARFASRVEQSVGHAGIALDCSSAAANPRAEASPHCFPSATPGARQPGRPSAAVRRGCAKLLTSLLAHWLFMTGCHAVVLPHHETLDHYVRIPRRCLV